MTRPRLPQPTPRKWVHVFIQGKWLSSAVLNPTQLKEVINGTTDGYMIRDGDAIYVDVRAMKGIDHVSQAQRLQHL